MDSAGTGEAQDRFLQLENRVLQQEGQLLALLREIHQVTKQQEQAFNSLAAQVQQLSAQPAQPPTPSSAAPPTPAAVSPNPANVSAVPEPRVGVPERYGGDPGGCRPFLTNCSILFSLQPYTFATEEARVAFTINHLTGRARLWGTAEWEQRTPACTSFLAFSTELRKVFDVGTTESEASYSLLQLKQGRRSVSDYSIDFRTLARQSKWNVPALHSAFIHGLADYVRDELAARDLPEELDEVISMAIRVDQRIRSRQHERSREQLSNHPNFQSPPAMTPVPAQGGDTCTPAEPMQVGRTRLSPEERQRRRGQNLCLYCAGADHFLSSCPAKARAQQ